MNRANAFWFNKCSKFTLNWKCWFGPVISLSVSVCNELLCDSLIIKPGGGATVPFAGILFDYFTLLLCVCMDLCELMRWCLLHRWFPAEVRSLPHFRSAWQRRLKPTSCAALVFTATAPHSSPAAPSALGRGKTQTLREEEWAAKGSADKASVLVPGDDSQPLPVHFVSDIFALRVGTD